MPNIKKPVQVRWPDDCYDLRLNRASFEKKYTVDPVTNCWNWQAGFHKQGYGMCGAYRKVDDKIIMITAHRASWRLYNGPITSENIMHTCHNPACVNPAHLAAATQKETMQKMTVAGRRNSGRGPRKTKPWKPEDRTNKLYARRVGTWKYKWTDEEIDFTRYATTEEIMARFNVLRKLALSLRGRARKGYSWLPPRPDPDQST